MYELYDITHFEDLDCALASALIMKNDNSNHSIFVSGLGSGMFFSAEKDDDGEVYLYKHSRYGVEKCTN